MQASHDSRRAHTLFYLMALLVLNSAQPPPGFQLPCNFTSTEEALQHCLAYDDLYGAVHEDLKHWRGVDGKGIIDEALMRKAVMQHTILGRMQKGIQLGFQGGKAYVIVANLTGSSGWLGHHANIFFTYMHVMLELEQLFGKAIPDVEFVIASGDRPMVLKPERMRQYYGNPNQQQATAPTTPTTISRKIQAAMRQLLQTSSTLVSSVGRRLRVVNGGAEQGEGWGATGAGSSALHGVAHDSAGKSVLYDAAHDDSMTADSGWTLQHGRKAHSSQEPQQQHGSMAHNSQETQQHGSRAHSSWVHQAQPSQQQQQQQPGYSNQIPQQQHGSAAHSSWAQQEQQPGHSSRSLLAPKKQAARQYPLPAPDMGTPSPVMRFCSSPAHADIRQPIFHFYTKKYAQRLLAKIPNITATYPWEIRKEVLFGRFAHYMRHVHPNVTETARLGANGTRICKVDSRDTMTCTVRQHMFDVASKFPKVMDIFSKPKIPLNAHAQYKYLVHVDGQGLSSRLDQLLPLGSLIFKEESGYTTFYHHLLKPYVHYIPFWTKDPQDALEGIAWAKAHDSEARAIGNASQQFAIRYLSKRARTCYWLKLIQEFAKLLTYKPASGAGAMNETWVPVEEYFEKVAKIHEGGARFTPNIEW